MSHRSHWEGKPDGCAVRSPFARFGRVTEWPWARPRLPPGPKIFRGLGRRANPHPGGTIAEVADHIDHIRKVAGIDHVGIGAAFYDAGTTSMVPGLNDVSRYPYLFAELLRRGCSDDDLLKIAGRNHLRAMRQMEKVAGP